MDELVEDRVKLISTLQEYDVDLKYFNKKFRGTVVWSKTQKATPTGMSFYDRTNSGELQTKSYRDVGLEIMKDLGWDRRGFSDLKVNMGCNYNDHTETYSGYISSVRLIVRR